MLILTAQEASIRPIDPSSDDHHWNHVKEISL